MNERETAELRRSLRIDRTTASGVKGCFVNSEKNIIACFERSFALIEDVETEKYLSAFRKGLSGAIGRSLINLDFSSKDPERDESHALLMKLCGSRLEDEEALRAFYEKIASAVKSEECYVLLLLYADYDVPSYGKDGKKSDDSTEVFSFIECLLCPVKNGKASLVYSPKEKTFVPQTGGSAIASPLRGFLFPAFEDRQTDIYGALLYTANTENSGEDFAAAAFGKTKLPMPAAEQGRSFKSLIAESLKEECSFELAKNLHLAIAEKIEEHKESREPDALLFDAVQMKEMLEDCGVSEEKTEEFSKQFRSAFGDNADLQPKNIDAVGRFEVRTPEVVVKVAKGSEHLIRREEIGGKVCLLIDASGGVEVNGMAVK